ncbi:hypothetical protein [Amaricoccus macauensis]|uniref:hypothetical protein n=1 Tax=Amaricoccus macauensis TaxID=57001 RepID=UPI003C79CE7A
MAVTTTDPGSRSVGELERDVETQRRTVSNTIDELQARASRDGIIDQVVKAVSENGGEVSRNLGRTLRDNPLPVLLTSVGIAWLMAGGGGPRLERSSYRDDYGSDDWRDDEDFDTPARGVGYTEPYHDPLMPPKNTSGGGAYTVSTAGTSDSSSDGVAKRAASGAKDAASRVAEGGRNAADKARAGAESASDAIRDRAGQAQGAMSDAGRAMRRNARSAHERATAAGRRGRNSLDSMMQEQPLVFGALALALGAAFGSSMPASQTENRLFGKTSARAKDTARRVAETEGAKMKAVGEAMVDEAANMADETADSANTETPDGREAVDRAEAKVRAAAERVAEAGRKESERQGVGESVRRDEDTKV